MTTIPPAPLFGQVLGQAEGAVRALLDTRLGALGVTFPQWAALRLAATVDPPALRDHLLTPMMRGTRLDRSEAMAVFDQIAELGWTNEDEGAVVLTARGTALHGTIAGDIAVTTHRLYGDLPEDDMGTTIRVLLAVAQRANAELGP